MQNEQLIVRALAALIDELPDLVDSGSLQLAAQMRTLMHRFESGEASFQDLSVALEDHPQCKKRWEKLFNEALVRNQLDQHRTRSGYQNLPGLPANVAKEEYVCPLCGIVSETWYRRSVAQEPPVCKQHNIRFVPRALLVVDDGNAF